MSSNLILNLVGIKEGKATEEQPPGFRAAEIIRCPHCSTRYWLLITPLNGSSRQQEDGILDALRMMTQIISSEHETGHSPRLSIPYRCSIGAVDQLEDHVCSAKTRLNSRSA
jgi:hypothetical protein